MNLILKYIREYFLREFNAWYLACILLLVTVIIYLNYWHGLEKKYAAGNTWWSNFSGYYLMYLIPFASAFLLQLLFYKDCSYYSKPWFWIILFAAPAIFSFRVNFDFHFSLVQKLLSGEDRIFYLRCINYIVRVFVVLLPVWLIWYIKDSADQPFYGVLPLQSVRPYLIMLLIMVPLIVAASTQRDFQGMYPRAQFIGNLYEKPGAWRYLLYELCYGFDFISIEFFFRGFLILSLLQICGTHAILPVAVFYCTIHLGKPMGEAISSFFGGTILGIVSFNAASIWGGLLMHLGIAWLMEAGGWLGNLWLPRKN